jgi:SRSO17 transposase
MVRVGAMLWQQVFDQLAVLIGSVFAQARSRTVALDYLRALLPDTPRRSCWQLGELAGHASPRRMQALLGEYAWDAVLLVEQVRTLVMAHLGCTEAVLAIDETAEIKKGDQTVGVARQYAGITGQVENCQTVVFLAYVTARAFTLVDFLLYLPKSWANSPEQREVAGVPQQVSFQTKPQLAIRLVQRAAAAGMAFAWVVADEVYGRGAALRTVVEALGKGYVLAVPANFQARLHIGAYSVRELVALVPQDNWQERSCGRGCKGHRWYQWAWIATAQDNHWVLIRRHPADPTQLAYFYCYAPHGATLATLVRVAGQRWPVETCIQHAKGLGIDGHQVRRWQAWHRHTALALAAGALLAIASAKPATSTATTEHDPGPAPLTPQPEPAAAPPAAPPPEVPQPAGGITPLPQPEAWHDTAPLPYTPDQQPPEDPGMIGVTVPEARRLFNLAATATDLATITFHLGWSDWRRRHQARSRWCHHQTRLRRDTAASP